MRPLREKYCMSSRYCCLCICANKQNLQCVLCISTSSNERKNFMHVASNYCNRYVWFVKIINSEKTAGFASLHFAPSSNLLHAASTTLRALDIVNIQSLVIFVKCSKMNAKGWQHGNVDAECGSYVWSWWIFARCDAFKYKFGIYVHMIIYIFMIIDYQLNICQMWCL